MTAKVWRLALMLHVGLAVYAFAASAQTQSREQARLNEISATLPSIVSRLRSASPKERETAASRIIMGAMAREDIRRELNDYTPVLVDSLDDSSPRVRSYVISALALIQPTPPEAALQRALVLLDDENQEVRASAFGVIARRGETKRSALDAVLRKLSGDPSGLVRGRAALCLEHLYQAQPAAVASDGKVVSALQSALNDESPFVRERASDALRRMNLL